MLIITSSFTANPLLKTLTTLLRPIFQGEPTIELVPFQVMEQLVSPNSLCANNHTGFNIVLIRFQDFVEKINDDNPKKNIESFKTHVNQLLTSLKAAASSSSARWVFCICPDTFSDKNHTDYQAACQQLESQLNTELSQLNNLIYFNEKQLLSLYPMENYQDVVAEQVAQIPYQPIFYNALGALISRGIYRYEMTPYKAIALDCDGTLWKGVCAESGWQGVELTPAHLELQRILVEQQESGVLLCLCSKNVVSDVFAVFDNRQEMVLKREHIVEYEINWNEKPDNIASLSQKLNIGLESFLFVDDNHEECEKVKVRCPSVTVLHLPSEDSAISRQIQHFWGFDSRPGAVSETAQQRTLLYKQQKQREEQKKIIVEKPGLTLKQYLESIKWKLSIRVPDKESDYVRITDLLARTTQFNIHKVNVAFPVDVFKEKVFSGNYCILGEVQDNYSESNIVCVVLYRIENKKLIIDQFVLSCRALQKNVEYNMVAKLAQLAEEAGASSIEIPFESRLVATSGNENSVLRNQPMLNFLKNLTSKIKEEDGDSKLFSLPTAEAKAALAKADSALLIDKDNEKKTNISISLQGATPRSDRDFLLLFSNVLQTPESVFSHVESQQEQVQKNQEESDPLIEMPKNAIESCLVDILKEILSLTQLSVLDSFIVLGLDSVKATYFISKVKEVTNILVSIVNVMYQYTTVRGLSELILSKQVSQKELMSPFVSTEIEPVMKDMKDSPMILSYPQRALWLIHQFNPKSSQYNVFMAWKINGQLNIEALQSAYSKLLARHEILRTTYTVVDGEPKQVIHSLQKTRFEFSVEEGENFTESQRQELVYENARRPYNLEVGPILRVNLLKCSDQEHVLMMTLPHINIDGWSFNLLIQELSHYYVAYSEQHNVEITIPNLHYADFAYWQRHYINDNYLKPHLDYWLKQLTDLTVLDLPTDYHRTEVNEKEMRGKRVAFNWDYNQLSHLHEFSKQTGVTLYTFLVALFSTFLSKYTAQQDIAFATIASGRHHIGLSNLLGFFSNLLILRMDLNNNPTFVELLQRANKVLSEAYTHQDVPFEILVNALSSKNVGTGASPLTRVALIFQNYRIHPLELGDVSIESALGPNDEIMLSDYTSTKFDLTICFQEDETGMKALIEYDMRLFENSTIQRFVQRLTTLMQNAVQFSQLPISQLNVLDEESKKALWFNSSFSSNKPLAPANLVTLFESKVESTPDGIALHFGNAFLTYRQLNQKANQTAYYLRSEGVQQDQIVAVIGEPEHPLVIVALLALLKLGAVYSPMTSDTPKIRLQHMLKNITFILSTDKVIADLKSTIELPSARFITLEDVENKLKTQPISSEDNLGCAIAPDALVYAIHTSGSTGTPKRVALEQKALVNLIQWQSSRQKQSGHQNILQYSTFSFDVFSQELFFTLLNGYTLHIPSHETKKSMEELLSFINKWELNQLFFPVVVLEFIAQAAIQQKNLLPSVNEIIVAGEALKITSNIRLFFSDRRQITLCNQYGPSETHVVSEHQLSGSPEQWSALPDIGQPIDNVGWFVLDAYLQPVDIGVVGDLYLYGEGFRGYPDQPELTQERFITVNHLGETPIRLYKTGDLACLEANGHVKFVGRNDDQVKISGYRIELSEIEACLLNYPKVAQAAVVAINRQGSHPQNKQLVAYIAEQNNESVDTTELQKFLAEYLPRSVIPGIIRILDTFPLTKHNKIDRISLSQNAMATCSVELAHIAPHTPIQRKVVETFENILNCGSLSIYDDLFALGLTSFTAVQAKSEINFDFKIDLQLDDLFRCRNVANLSDTINDELTQKRMLKRIIHSNPISDSLKLMKQGKSKQHVLFLIHPIGGTVFCYANLVGQLDEQWTCYAIEDPSICADMVLFKSIPEMAQYYVEIIKKAQPDGPYFLGGYSFGGLVCLEIAKQLRESGKLVKSVVLFDTLLFSAIPAEKKVYAKQLLTNCFQEDNKKLMKLQEDHKTWLDLPTNRLEMTFQYQPDLIDQPWVLFRAKQSLFDFSDPLNFCGKFSTQEPKRYEIDVNHNDFFEKDNLRFIAATLNKILQSFYNQRKMITTSIYSTSNNNVLQQSEYTSDQNSNSPVFSRSSNR